MHVFRYTLKGTLEGEIAKKRQDDIKALDLLMHEDKEMNSSPEHVDAMLNAIKEHDPTKKKKKHGATSRKKQKTR